MSFFDRINWHPSIGDPTVLGWLTVAAYALSAILCYQVALHNRQIFSVHTVRQRNLWLGMTLVFVLLCINKQLDLQTFFTQSLRYIAIRDGWYQDRRAYQELFIVMVVAIGGGALWMLGLVFRHCFRQNSIAVLGIMFLLIFIVIRASSFNKVDYFLDHSFWFFRVNHILELTGIMLVIVNAVLLLKSRKVVNHQ